MTQEREVLRMALEALRKARRKVLTTEECHAVIMSIKEALAQPDQYAKGNWINAEDVSRNVKALDIALNGEGAASSPLLIDVLGQVQAEARRIGKPVLKALAQPEQIPPSAYSNTHQPEQEPVAWLHVMDNTEGLKANGTGIVLITQKRKHPFGKPGIDFSKSYPVTSTPLYTTPPQRKPLTDEHIGVIAIKSQDGISPHDDTLRFARAIEAAHGIKE